MGGREGKPLRADDSGSVAGKVRENLGAAKGNGRAKDTIEAGVFEEGERPEENTWR